MGRESEPSPTKSVYRCVFRNYTLMLLWSGQTISTVGDAFFNLAAMWVVYTQSGSALQTALVQVIWQLPSILIGPLAGIWADRGDRKKIMVVTNVLSAAVVGALAATTPAGGHLSRVFVFVAVFLLNSLAMFLAPAQFSIMPEIVDRDLLATASGLFSTATGAASLLGNAMAGVVIAAVGAAWAFVVDALSFLVAALSIAASSLPARAIPPFSFTNEKRPSLLRELVDGWRAIVDQPIVQACRF